MLKFQWIIVIALAVTAAGAFPWDLVVSVNEQLDFYENGNKKTESMNGRSPTVLGYDSISNNILYVDVNSNSTNSYNLVTKKHKKLVDSKTNIYDIAFDPVRGILFWTEPAAKSIFKTSITPDSKSTKSKLLRKLENQVPDALAVDSCRGYIYWTNTDHSGSSIERAKFDGTDSKTIVKYIQYLPISIALDQQTKQIFWISSEGLHYSIEKADLDGGNRVTLLTASNDDFPNSISVSKDSIYWISKVTGSVWKLPKNTSSPVESGERLFKYDSSIGDIFVNYKIEDQIRGVPECKNMMSMVEDRYSQKTTTQIDSVTPTPVVDYTKYCERKGNKFQCKCPEGQNTEKCEAFVCMNHCFEGVCSLNINGQPQCRCNSGYTGERCEINMCHGYCLNEGVCAINGQQPVCKCNPEHEGSRCEVLKATTTTECTTQAIVSTEVPIVKTTAEPIQSTSNTPRDASSDCNCTNVCVNSTFIQRAANGDGEFVDTEDTSVDRSIIALSVICCLLTISCVLLITKIMQLTKRPRIKKRFIVNKNVTPMTARPDQCEITIENCCNMNICETPCFEPRSTIRPTLLDSKKGKEEKKNLISHMEYPDD